VAKPKTPKDPATPKPPRATIYSAAEAWLIKQLRQVSIGWPPKETCLNAARIGPSKYQCAACKGVFKNRYDLKADHVEPVVCPHAGYQGIGIFAERLFVEAPEAWQALCGPCHQTKTNEENAIRRAASKARLEAGTP
jgi:5-methylcytosine-specific restriction endonuclease McrA